MKKPILELAEKERRREEKPEMRRMTRAAKVTLLGAAVLLAAGLLHWLGVW